MPTLPTTAPPPGWPLLAPLCWRHILQNLDPFSLQQLKLSSKLFYSLCTGMCDSNTLTQLPLDTLKTADLAGEGLQDSFLQLQPATCLSPWN